MKQVLFITGLDQRKQKNCQAIFVDMTFKSLCKFAPDFKNSAGLKLLFGSPCNCIMIAIYRDNQGNEKRRMVGGNMIPANQQEIEEAIKMIADGLSLKIDRILIGIK